MSPQELDVAIIGAGTAGLSARGEVAKVTGNYRVFDPGPLGTTCARTACMPSKAFLQSAHDYHRRHAFGALGIDGAEHLKADWRRVLSATRALRDDLAAGVIDSMSEWRNTHLVPFPARFAKDGTLHAGDGHYRARATIVATGSKPVVPPGWRERFGDRILTSDDFFELEDLPERVAVAGLGPVGLELGQALARLGVEVTAFDPDPSIGGLRHPDLVRRLREALGREMRLIRAEAELDEGRNGDIAVSWDGGGVTVDAVLVAMGRSPVLEDTGLEALCLDLQGGALADLPSGRLNPRGTRLYFAGDAGVGPALLHEASDEGRIAGYCAARDRDASFLRRTPLRLVFCDPQIAVAGADWDELAGGGAEASIGAASFDGSGRTRLQRASGGEIRVFAERATGRLLGAEIVAPEAEHLGHIMAHAIDREATLPEVLRMPVYHPTHEEVLRRALRDAVNRCDLDLDELEAIRCEDPPVDCDARA